MDIKDIKRKVVEQLVEGYEFATQLQLLLSNPFHHHLTGSGTGSGSGPTDELMVKILGCFDKTMSVLGSLETVSVSVGGSRSTLSGGESPAATVSDVRCEDSGDSRKRALGVNKGKRGCYKRKRKAESWTVESNTVEDTHAWRKYGQKEILNAKHPRSYFRCTHKYTQGCKAIKQVQKVEHKPGMFQVTYIGDHTCNPTTTTTKFHSSHHQHEFLLDTDEADSETTCCISIDKVASTAGGDDDIDQSKEEEETTNGEACPSTGDLSLVWQDECFMSFVDDHDLMYCVGETTNSRGADTDLVVFGSCDFVFGDAYCV